MAFAPRRCNDAVQGFKSMPPRAGLSHAGDLVMGREKLEMRNAARAHVRVGIRLLLLLFASSVLGLALLVLVYSLPGRWRMMDNLQQSVLTFENEPEYAMTIRLYPGTQKDNFTDALMISHALYADPGQSALDKALHVYHEEYPGTTSQSLAQLITGYAQEEPQVVSYGRYWHGYLVFLRPLLMIMGYEDIRACIAMVHYALAAGLLLTVCKMGYTKLLVPLLASLLTITPLGTQVNIQFLCVYLLGLGGAWLMLTGREWFHGNRERALYFYLMWGVMTGYFDLFTYPMITLCYPLFFELFLSREAGLKSAAGMILRAGIVWSLGYFGMWALKWTWGTVLTGENFFADAFQATMRHVGNEAAEATFSRWDALLLNMKDLVRPAYGFLYAVCAGLVLWRAVRRPAPRGKLAAACLTMLAVALIPVAWICITSSHAYVHHFFTHKDLCICVLALFGIPAMAGAGAQPSSGSRAAPGR